MKRASRAALLAIVTVVAACSRPNLQSTGGGYGPGASAPSVETSVGEPAAVEAAAVEPATETSSEPSTSDTTGR